MKLITVFEYDELNLLQYPILVEMWNKIMNTSRGREKLRDTFNESERKIIKIYYKIFKHWHLKTGTPHKHQMSIENYELMKKAIAFFGTY